MTACVNKHSKRVAAVISASLVGALSLGVAVPAFAAEGVEALSAETDQDQWNAATFVWNTPMNDYGVYSVEPGEVFALESVTDVFGQTVNPGDYTVLYFTVSSSTDTIEGTSTLVNARQAVNGQPGGMPKVVTADAEPGSIDHYAAVVVKLDGATLPTLTNTTSYSQITGSNHVAAFQVAEAAKTLEGAYAYEVNGVDTSDTSFVYTGGTINYAFADADGNELNGSDYDITWISADPASASSSPTQAGTYTAQLNGKGAYAGTSAKVTFTVDKLDLTKATLTTDVYANGVDDPQFTNDSGDFYFAGPLYADGTELDAEAFELQTYGYTDTDGVFHQLVNNDPTGRTSGVFHLKSAITSDQNVIGGPATVDLVVVDQLADVTYDDEAIATAFPGDTMTVNLSKGQSFDPELFATDKGAATVTATKDGEQVDEFTEPGTYKVHVEVPAPKNCAYGYSKDLTVVVIARKINGPCNAYVAVDGKSVASYNPSYTGEEIVPSIAVKDAKGKTVAADGYTVTYKDADGNAVDSIVEPGDYTIEIAFPGTNVPSIDVDLTVDKASVNSAKASKDVYAYTGETITPSFIAYTGDDLTGTAVELTGDGFGATYYKGVKDTDGNWVADSSQPVNASNLKDEGVYFANVTVSSTNEHYAGTVKDVMFEISSYAAYADVAADAWYADNVYNAAELGYMTGISGTNLFMPEAEISRAELAQVFFNMAGNAKGSQKYYPTAFSDVDGWAWYAQPVAWASNAGVVTGYDATTFGPSDKATREQVAVMLYRYAKGQGKDVTVDDVDGALAKYTDGDQVSDWAREAMAWAVENGIFGQDTDELWAQENIQRAAVATIAVRFQPEALPEA